MSQPPLQLQKLYSQKTKNTTTLKRSVNFILSSGDDSNKSNNTYGEWSSNSQGGIQVERSFCMGVRSTITEKHLISGDIIEKDGVNFAFISAELIGPTRDISFFCSQDTSLPQSQTFSVDDIGLHDGSTKCIIGHNDQGLFEMLKCLRTHKPIGTPDDFPTSVVVTEVEDLEIEPRLDGCNSNASNLGCLESVDMSISVAVGQNDSVASGVDSDDVDTTALLPDVQSEAGVSLAGNSLTLPLQTLPACCSSALQSVTPPAVELTHQRSVIRQLGTQHMKELRVQQDAESRERRGQIVVAAPASTKAAAKPRKSKIQIVQPTQEELAAEKAEKKRLKMADTELKKQLRKNERKSYDKLKRAEAKLKMKKEEADRTKQEKAAAAAAAAAATATEASKKSNGHAKIKISVVNTALTSDERAELVRYRALAVQMQTCHDAGGPVTIVKDRQGGLKVKLAIPLASSPPAGLKGESPNHPVSQKSMPKSSKKLVSVTPHGKVVISNTPGKPAKQKTKDDTDSEEWRVDRCSRSRSRSRRSEDRSCGENRGRSRDRAARTNERSRDAHGIQHSERSQRGRGGDYLRSNESREERHERGSRERRQKRSRDQSRESRSSHDRDRRDRSRSRDDRRRESKRSHDRKRRDRSNSRDRRGHDRSSNRDNRHHDRSSSKRDRRRHGRSSSRDSHGRSSSRDSHGRSSSCDSHGRNSRRSSERGRQDSRR